MLTRAGVFRNPSAARGAVADVSGNCPTGRSPQHGPPSSPLTGDFLENIAASSVPHTVPALVDFMKFTMLA